MDTEAFHAAFHAGPRWQTADQRYKAMRRAHEETFIMSDMGRIVDRFYEGKITFGQLEDELLFLLLRRTLPQVVP